jgi:hypothetical protein
MSSGSFFLMGARLITSVICIKESRQFINDYFGVVTIRAMTELLGIYSGKLYF